MALTLEHLKKVSATLAEHNLFNSPETHEAKSYLKQLITPFLKENNPQELTEQAAETFTKDFQRFFRIRTLIAPASKGTAIDTVYGQLKAVLSKDNTAPSAEEQVSAAMLKDLFDQQPMRKPVTVKLSLSYNGRELENLDKNNEVEPEPEESSIPEETRSYYEFIRDPNTSLAAICRFKAPDPTKKYCDKEQPLIHLAIENDWIDLLKVLVNKDTNKFHKIVIECLNGTVSKDTPLRYAAIHNKPEAIKVLVEAGADVNAASTFRGRTALSCAIDHKEELTDVVAALMKAKDIIVTDAVVAAAMKKNFQHITVLLVEKIANGHMKDEVLTKLQLEACQSVNIAMIKLLMEKKIFKYELELGNGQNIFHTLATHAHLISLFESIELPVQSSVIDAFTHFYRVPITLALESNNLEGAKKLIQLHDNVRRIFDHCYNAESFFESREIFLKWYADAFAFSKNICNVMEGLLGEYNHKNNARSEGLILLMYSKLANEKLDRDTSFKLIQLATTLSNPKIAVLFASDERFELHSGMLALNKGYHAWRPFHAALESRGYPLTPAFVGNLIEEKLKPVQEENAALKAEVGKLKQMLGQVLALLQAQKGNKLEEKTSVSLPYLPSQYVSEDATKKHEVKNNIGNT